MQIGVSTWLWTSPLTTAEAERLVPLIARMGYDSVRSAGDLLGHVQVSENHRGVPGTGLTDWAAFARGLRAIEYRGLVVLESFTPENRDLAGAVCIWNRRTRTQDEFAERGLEFLRRTFT